MSEPKNLSLRTRTFAGINPPWTCDDVTDLHRRFEAGETPEDIAEQQGRSAGSVRRKINELGLASVSAGALMREPLYDDTQAGIDRDLAFQSALRAAIEAGTERAPIGVHTAPCTKAPRFIDPRHSRDASFATSPTALCADLGE